MSHKPSWAQLQTELCKIKADGESGFEGFVRDLFQAETGFTYHLARKGDQPTGDVYSPGSGTVLEAKRYNTAKVSEDIGRSFHRHAQLIRLGVLGIRLDIDRTQRLCQVAQVLNTSFRKFLLRFAIKRSFEQSSKSQQMKE